MDSTSDAKSIHGSATSQSQPAFIQRRPENGNLADVRRSETIANIVTFIVILAMLSSVMAGIAAAEWMPGLSVILWAGVIGAIAGAALSFSQFPSFAAHITSGIYGMFVVAIIGGTRPNIVEAGGGLEGWRARIFLMADKVSDFANAASQNGTSRETLIFILILSALFWLLGYTAAWYSFRTRRIWHVVLPTGVTLFSNAYYYSGNNLMAPYLVIFLLCALVLLVQSHFADRQEVWQREGVRFAQSLRGSFIVAGIVIATIALVFSWRVTATVSSPSTISALQRMNPAYAEVMARWNRMFSTLNNYNLKDVDRYSRSHVLSGPRNLSPEPVMSVQAPSTPPLGRYYWRAQVLDYYDGIGWTNTAQNQVELDVNAGNVQQPVYLARAEVPAGFTLFRGTDSIWTASQPVRADLPSRGILADLGSSDAELLQLSLPVALLPGNRYQSVGSTTIAQVDQLRGARAGYPEAISADYLQLPSTVPNRVKELAQFVVSRAGAETAFDKAQAVESFLRSNIEYDEKLQAPPKGMEASDYVLYVARRAYCDYYSTAMIVMLRSLGVPARMAIGYAQGTVDPVTAAQSNTDLLGNADPLPAGQTAYTVKANDAHAWVEVFFPDYGWVEFEPTANQPPLRPDQQAKPNPEQPENGVKEAEPPTPTPAPAPNQQGGTPPTPTPQPGQPPPDSQSPNQAQPPKPPPSASEAVQQALQDAWKWFWNSWWPYLFILPILLGLAYVGLLIAERAGLGKYPPIERAYAMLTRWASWLGVGRHTQLTPYEQAVELARFAPTSSSQAQNITDLYVKRRFGNRDASVVAAPARAAEAVLPADDFAGADSVTLSTPSFDPLALWKEARVGLRKAWVKARTPAWLWSLGQKLLKRVRRAP